MNDAMLKFSIFFGASALVVQDQENVNFTSEVEKLISTVVEQVERPLRVDRKHRRASADTPPMGWRSWNLYGETVNQTLMENVMLALTNKKRLVDGVPTSFCDLGYCDVGLDDGWQSCGAYGANQFTHHDVDGSSVINYTRFPNMKAMVDLAHSVNLTAGWYLNNCICRDHCSDDSCYQKDAEQLNQFGFDSVKIDGCGHQTDMDKWNSLLNTGTKKTVIENCYWGCVVPTADTCPYHYFRTSADIRANYGSMLRNLQTYLPHAKGNISRPGCWAYLDMLEIGVKHGNGGALDEGLSPVESRSHFAAWAIVSSPLFLSHDVNDEKANDELWPIVANPEAIAVNQAWAGHAGTLFEHPFIAEQQVSMSQTEWQRMFALRRRKNDPPRPSAGPGMLYKHRLKMLPESYFDNATLPANPPISLLQSTDDDDLLPTSLIQQPTNTTIHISNNSGSQNIAGDGRTIEQCIRRFGVYGAPPTTYTQYYTKPHQK